MMRVRRRPLLWAVSGLGLASLFVSGCKPTAGAPPPAGPVEVAVVSIQSKPLLLTTRLPGRTAAYLTAEIRPQVNGIIQSRLFTEGAFVRAGQTLYKIDPEPYEAVLGQAKADLATAEANLVTAQANLPSLKLRADRYHQLVDIHAIGQQDYDDAQAALVQAEATVTARKASIEASRAAIETARINLSYTPIKAPISGRIGKSSVTVGALASAYQGTALTTIQQIDPIFVDVVQANADLLRLRKNLETGRLKRDGGQNRVKLILEDGSTYQSTGTLQFRDFSVDSSTGAVTLRMVFANPREVLLPGMFVRAEVEEGVRQQAILIPQEGVSRDPKGNPYAWVVGADNKVHVQPLELERALGDDWLVMNGLAAGDRVVVEGGQKLRDGVPVRAVPRAEPPASGKAGGGHV
jgi:membrane fusion protein, multidrug efflux system